MVHGAESVTQESSECQPCLEADCGLRRCETHQPSARNQTGYEIARCQRYHQTIGLRRALLAAMNVESAHRIRIKGSQILKFIQTKICPPPPITATLQSQFVHRSLPQT